MSDSPPVAAVVVTFLPDDYVISRLEAIRAQVAYLAIVDNGSSARAQKMLEDWSAQTGSTLIANQVNCGLATALNQGIRLADARGFNWVITFDQDSRPEPGFVAAQVASTNSAPASARVAVVGANTFDERQPGRPDEWLVPARIGFRRRNCRAGDLVGVTFVITSGAMTSVPAWRELGGFDEGLFIDYIDHDFCLKARRAGWKVIVSANAHLAHNLGSKRDVMVAGRRVRPTFHSASRHYYMARNRLLMWRRYALGVPHWWLFDVCFGGLNTVRVLIAEDQRRQKLAAMLHGTWDGLLGRTGPLPAQ